MNIVDWAIRIIGQMGGPGVALLLFLECVFPPIPSEVILPLAGVTAGQGTNNYWIILAWTIVGSLVGAWLLYGLGVALGGERVRWLCEKLPLLEVEDYDKSVDWFARHGRSGIFFGRMVPGIRSLISIPAGVYKMPIWQFTLLTAAGSAIWNTIFVSFGYFLGENWHVIEPYTNWISNIVYVIILGLLAWFVVSRVLRNRRRARDAA
ncbi:DedA family protein [Aestuariimicrobium sp. p3-SID1156]|uniref:DedA family protein n=1 Tax=Aestuariimicrobium sp. p3-SID1156 TaxID=2916038 RepID=UPI00223B6CB6|nr:DedA family protein [Aestuariimicrobium sp. p3-SID1156]MCT1458022.1 DedA family protein [Aestuariimicrobium sp. p3-SID1156]